MNLNELDSKARAYLGEHKGKIMWVLAALLLLLAGYGAGRYAQPAKVVEKERVVTKVQEKIVYQDRVQEQKQVEQQVHVRKHKVTVTTKKPDGEQTTTTTEDTSNDASKDTQDVRVEYRDRVVEKVIQQTVTKEKVTTRQPRWSVHAGLGVSIPHYLGQPTIGVPGLQGWVVQAGADVRVVGPFWLGAWGNTQGTLGGELRFTW